MVKTDYEVSLIVNNNILEIPTQIEHLMHIHQINSSITKIEDVLWPLQCFSSSILNQNILDWSIY